MHSKDYVYDFEDSFVCGSNMWEKDEDYEDYDVDYFNGWEQSSEVSTRSKRKRKQAFDDPVLKRLKLGFEEEQEEEEDEEQCDSMYGSHTMNWHFTWANLVLDGQLSHDNNMKAKTSLTPRTVKNNMKSKMPLTPRRKYQKKFKKKGKLLKKKKKINKPKQKRKPKAKKSRRCPCKKVHGWNGVFSRSSLDGSKKYFILISIRGTKVYQGSFQTEEECAIAYDDLVVQERGLGNGEKLNFPERYNIKF